MPVWLKPTKARTMDRLRVPTKPSCFYGMRLGNGKQPDERRPTFTRQALALDIRGHQAWCRILSGIYRGARRSGRRLAGCRSLFQDAILYRAGYQPALRSIIKTSALCTNGFIQLR